MTTGIPIETRLAELNMNLPDAFELKEDYSSRSIIGSLPHTSGQRCVGSDRKIPAAYKGKLGSKITDADGYAAARLCRLQILADARLVLGWLDRISKCVRLGGLVNAEPDFVMPGAMNGASDMIVEIIAVSGRHDRTTSVSRRSRLEPASRWKACSRSSRGKA